MEKLIRFTVVLGWAALVSLDGSRTLAHAPDKASRIDDRAAGIPVLWRDPGIMAARDLYWGPGSAEAAPMPPFTFEKEDTSGTNPKLQVVDSRGGRWNVKFPGRSPSRNEVHSEIAASRLTWALGYMVEENYYVPEGKIEGVEKLGSATAAVGPDETFRAARFERRPPHVVYTGRSWTFDNNPFLGSKELSGLKILTALLNNWDVRDSNTNILRVTAVDGPVEDWHVFSDLGATFGRTADYILWHANHSRWNLSDYQRQRLIDEVRGNTLYLYYRGGPSIHAIPLDHARWFAGLARQLDAAQVSRALEAAGASAEEIEGFTTRVMEKIDELWRSVSPT